MSRQFNFMPSRYAVEASRPVTPSHADPSRNERDTSVTDGVTSTAVTRDTPVTSGRCPAGQTSHCPVTDAEREARARQRQEEYSHQKLIEGLGEMRIMGRHAKTPAPPRDIALWCEGLGIPLEQGHAAYEAGQQDRARGVRCMCMRCGGQQVYKADALRMAYSRRRYHELRAEGLTFERAWSLIDNEIRRGEHLER